MVDMLIRVYGAMISNPWHSDGDTRVSTGISSELRPFLPLR